MKLITLDASEWTDHNDLWRALLTSLSAPAWHGDNLNALWDTIAEPAYIPFIPHALDG